MRSLFWLLTLAALAIGIALLGRLSDGYVLWVVPPWRVEVSFNLFVLAQVAMLAFVYLLLRTIINTLKLPRIVGEYRAGRARRRDELAATEALRLFWEGRYGHALKSAEQVAQTDDPEKVGAGGTAAGIAALVGLKAAHALRDNARIDTWRAVAAARDASGWRTARLMAELRIALDGRDFAAAQAALDQLGPKERRQISVQRLALRLAQGRGDWTELLHIARQLEKHGALSAEQAWPLRLRAQLGLIDGLLDNPAQLIKHWQTIPGAERTDPQVVQRAVRALTAAGECENSAQLIEDQLDEHWDASLLEHYAGCSGGDVLRRIAHCEKWLGEHPQEGELLLALGRLCARQQLWGKAQSYFEASLAVAPSSTAYLELARLLDQLGQPEAANRHYRAAADFVQAQLPQAQSRGGRKSV